MQLGRVVGTATATVKHPTFQGERMLVVQLETPAGQPDGEPSWPSTGWGGPGDLVLVTNDGRALQEKLGPTTPGRWSVIGLPDETSSTWGRLPMRIAEVIGRVTLSRFNPQLRGGRFLIALPMPLAALTEGVAGSRRRSRRLRRSWAPARAA